jgi:outer membrane protein assembly factor BamD
MFFDRVHIKIFIIGFLLLIGSCSGYEKLLKSHDYKLKYTKAMEFYEEEEYVKAATLLDQIAPVYRGTIKADTVFYYQAMSYYMQRDYILAGHYFSQLAEDYPNSVYAEEADYMTGYCYYKLSPKPSLDQENTIKAMNAFQLFMIKYPASPRVEETQLLIQELRDKLVEKSYLNGKLYYDLGDYKAAIIALRNSLNDYPNTKHREELMFLILKSSYLLADNSIIQKRKERFQDTIDEYYSFIGEFPESKYRREAERMYEEAMNIAGTDDQLTDNQ